MFRRFALLCLILPLTLPWVIRDAAYAQPIQTASVQDWQRAETQLLFAFDQHVPHRAGFVEAQVVRSSLRLLLNLIQSQALSAPPPGELVAAAIARMEEFGHHPRLSGRDGLISLFEIAAIAMTGAIDPYSQFVPSLGAQSRRARLFGEVFEMGLTLEAVPEGARIRSITPARRADQAGLKPGDIILQVDNADLTDTDIETIAIMLDSLVDRDLTLILRRPGEREQIEILLPRGGSATQRSESIRIRDIVYIRLRSFGADAREMIEREIIYSGGVNRAGSKGIILDLRGNSGGDLEQGALVANSFLNGGKIVTVEDRNPAYSVSYSANEGDLANGLPIIVLMDRFSASASEMVAAALQDHDRARIIGVPSTGKGTVQTVYPIGALGTAYLTTGRFYRPSGEALQDNPVQPDILLSNGRLNRTGVPVERCPQVEGTKDAWVDCAVGILHAGGILPFLHQLRRVPAAR